MFLSTETLVYVVCVGLILLIVVNAISESEALSWWFVLLCGHLHLYRLAKVVIAPAKANTSSKGDRHATSIHILTSFVSV